MLFFILKLLARTWSKYPNQFWVHLFLSKSKRFKVRKFRLFGKQIYINDWLSYFLMFDEIFNREIYRFESQKEAPLIIDGGANVGLSSIFFKKHFPKAKIIAFEPDPSIAKLTQHNFKAFGLEDITLVQKALWNEETELSFASDGAAGGKITTDDKLQVITTTSLVPYLQETVDFLKLDIEGAEYTVLQNCQKELQNVKNLFVEYHSEREKPQKLAEILRILTDVGFRYYIEHNGIQSKQPFVKIDYLADFDVMLNIYAYRV